MKFKRGITFKRTINSSISHVIALIYEQRKQLAIPKVELAQSCTNMLGEIKNNAEHFWCAVDYACWLAKKYEGKTSTFVNIIYYTCQFKIVQTNVKTNSLFLTIHSVVYRQSCMICK